jgi:TatD DNase family protein
METKFIDIHAHLADKAFDGGREELCSELSDFIVLNAGEGPEDNSKVIDIGVKHPNILPCIGLHPNALSSLGKVDIARSVDYLATHINRAFAISEIGLDYRGKSDREKTLQKNVLSEIFELTELKEKVCIIHSRKAIEDILSMLRSFKIKAIIHNFEGNQNQYLKAVEAGVYISISTGFIKYKRDNLIKKIDLNKLFLETDSPVLSPDSKINTPLNIRKVLNYVATLRSMNESELKDIIFSNFKDVFYG